MPSLYEYDMLYVLLNVQAFIQAVRVVTYHTFRWQYAVHGHFTARSLFEVSGAKMFLLQARFSLGLRG